MSGELRITQENLLATNLVEVGSIGANSAERGAVTAIPNSSTHTTILAPVQGAGITESKDLKTVFQTRGSRQFVLE